jgi:predicted Fe-Mo cluster-binding NifX family protein
MNKKIAVPVDGNGVLDSHFGHCQFFEIFETNDNKIVSQLKVTPPPHEPGVLPKWLVKEGVTDVIAGGIGDKAIKILNHFQINVHKGAPILYSNSLVESFLDETLQLSENNCNHDHQHEHHHNHHHEHHHQHHDKNEQ